MLSKTIFRIGIDKFNHYFCKFRIKLCSNTIYKLFTNNILSKLNLGQGLSSSLSGLIPTILGKTSSFIKDQDGDGDVDLNDILLSLTKSGVGKAIGAGIVTSVLGGLFKKR